jgi:hypothetical protein
VDVLLGAGRLTERVLLALALVLRWLKLFIFLVLLVVRFTGLLVFLSTGRAAH